MQRIVRSPWLWLASLLFVLPAVEVLAQDALSKELMRLEDLWAAAAMKKDGAAVGKLLSDQFLSFDREGKLMDKAGVIKGVSEDKEQYLSGSNSNYKVQSFGDTAVIVGVWTAVVQTATGSETRRNAWTDTWMKQADGQWLCIASQSTRLENTTGSRGRGVPGGIAGGVIGGLPGPPPPPGPMRVGGIIKEPARTKHVPPVYPPIAQQAKIQGVVIVEAIIGTDGKVREARILRPVPMLDQAALDAVRQWEYEPTLLAGQPVAVVMTITVTFTLK
jgi:TonB family protein